MTGPSIRDGAIGVHEAFTSYVEAGFTRAEALQIVIEMLKQGAASGGEGK